MPRRRLTLAAVALMLLCIAMGEPQGVPPGFNRFESRHYLVEVQGGDAKQLATILEQAYEQWRAFFEAEPKPILQDARARLRVRVFASKDEYVAALTADRVIDDISRDAGGCFAGSNQTVYLWDQFYPDATRALLIHEATHQYQDLAIGKFSSSRWYVEGIAEYFAMHTWDGQKLRLGVIPTIGTENQPAIALHRFEHQWKFRLRKIAADTGDFANECYPDAWALVTFLIQEDRRLFNLWAQHLREGVEPGEAWDRTFGPKGWALNERYIAWLRSQQRPWRVAYGAWQQVGDAIEGMERPLLQAIAVRTGVMRALDVTVEFRAPQTRAGVLFDYQSDGDYSFVACSEGGRAAYVQMRDGVPAAHRLLQLPAAVDGRMRMSLRVSGGNCEVFAGGEAVGQFASPAGELGVIVHGGTARFHDLRFDDAVEARPPAAAR